MASKTTTPRKDATLRNIAQAANVSIWLVSSVLNNRYQERRISPASAEKVRRVAAEMGYIPNVNARQLRRNSTENRTLTLAVITNSKVPFSLTEHLMRSLRGVTPDKRPITFDVKFYNSGELSQLRDIRSSDHFNAAIISNTTLEDDAFLEANPLPYPVVIVNRQIKGYSCVVDPDHIGKDAAHILRDTGSRLPLVLQPKVRTQSSIQRAGSFTDAMCQFLGEKPKALICNGSSVEDGFVAMGNFLKKGGKLDSLYGLTDDITVGACHALQLAGLRIPQDVCVVGIGDNKLSPYLNPPLTTVGGKVHDLGRSLAELLREQLGIQKKPSRTICLPISIQLRRSTERGKLANA